MAYHQRHGKLYHGNTPVLKDLNLQCLEVRYRLHNTAGFLKLKGPMQLRKSEAATFDVKKGIKAHNND